MDCIGLPMHCISPSVVGINKLMHFTKDNEIPSINKEYYIYVRTFSNSPVFRPGINLFHFIVIPGLTKPAPDLIRGNPVFFVRLDSRVRGNDETNKVGEPFSGLPLRAAVACPSRAKPAREGRPYCSELETINSKLETYFCRHSEPFSLPLVYQRRRISQFEQIFT